ncbi:type II/IV secretion system ATPase subunit [Halorubrum cibi]|uniref:Type IV secretory pathway ATPase VirB11/Archaellum biosynthesis ATPase n=1 Tax=Halorubrum cibi TaxID=413815 RepID=A0A521AYV1_9EURY|nr:Type IV secretory pathway ATPase VirB11/Archaellum biosynthesis ATPase [Halorubrum cibi]
MSRKDNSYIGSPDSGRTDERRDVTSPTLRIGGGSGGDDASVPAPVPPDDPEAWYAPDVRAQYESAPGVVATIRERDGGRFGYDVREPPLAPADERALDRIREHFSAVRGRRPLTRAGAIERAEAGFEPKYERVLDRLISTTAAARRRIGYHALCEIRLFGDLTPVALDGRIAVADVGDDRELIVHTDAFAPLETGVDADAEYVERVAGERLARYAVEFAGFAVDVVIYRERLLGSDAFETKYAALEPDLLPGDEALIRDCERRIWETPVDRLIDDRTAFVAEHARRYLSRRLAGGSSPRGWVATARERARSALADRGLVAPSVDPTYADDRLEDLVYYVLRDFVGEGVLTVPIRDPHLEDVEANRVGERVKVVPRPAVLSSALDGAVDDSEADAVADGSASARDGIDPLAGGGRIPTNLAFTDESRFVDVVTRLAARDGVELNASTPSAKVNLDVAGVSETVRCAVALPVISADGPHVSIRKQAPDPLTPVDLIARNALSTELVTLLWLLYEHRGVVLFAGPTGAGKTTLMNAHMPFIPFDDRPISIDEGSREVRLPHETGVALTTRDHENDYKAVSMATLMTEANYLNPDVEVIAEINTPASFETFAETVNTGHGVVGTTHAADVETLVNRAIERGLPPYLLREIDLVVFPRQVGGDRYVAQAVEPLSPAEYDALDPAATESRTGDPKHGGAGLVERDDTTVHYNTVAWRDPAGGFRMDGAPTADAATSYADDRRRLHALARLAERTDRDLDAVESEFAAKHRYVEYLVRDGLDDFDELFEFLADLRADEAATVERAARSLRREAGGDGRSDDDRSGGSRSRGAP